MTNTPSERDGEPLGPPIIDEVHLFTPATEEEYRKTYSPEGRFFFGEAFKTETQKSVPFKRGLGRGFLISASNAGPLKGTKMHAALEDFIQAEGPLKPGSYHYSAASGRWTKAPKSEDLEGISHVSFSADVPNFDPTPEQIATVMRSRFLSFPQMVTAVNLHGDEALKLPYYALNSSKENTVPKPDPFNETNT